MNKDNTSMQIDPILAKQLFADGAFLLITGVPIGTEFGIDLCSYTVGENFRGVKMIPPGPHFIWCSSQGPYGDAAPRVGLIHFFHSKEIVVREWNHNNEELGERKTADPDLEKRRIREHLCELDQFLAAYDYRYVSEWKQLTDTITESTVERCRPALGHIRSNVELQSCPDSERPRGPLREQHSLIKNESDLLPNLKPISGTAPQFFSIPDRIPKNAKPSDISQHCMDRIHAIELLLENFTNPNEVIEEIQLSFVFFLAGYSFESLEHWRKLLNLLACSEAAIEKYKLLYMKYSEVLPLQLPYLPEELMEPTKNNTIYKDVGSLLKNLYSGGLVPSFKRFSKKISKSMRWEFEGILDDDPEDLPVLVETI